MLNFFGEKNEDRNCGIKVFIFPFPRRLKLQARGVLFHLEKQMGGQWPINHRSSISPAALPTERLRTRHPAAWLAVSDSDAQASFHVSDPISEWRVRPPDAYMIMARRLFFVTKRTDFEFTRAPSVKPRFLLCFYLTQ